MANFDESDDERSDSGDKAIRSPLKKNDFLDEEAIEDNDLYEMYDGLDGMESDDQEEDDDDDDGRTDDEEDGDDIDLDKSSVNNSLSSYDVGSYDSNDSFLVGDDVEVVDGELTCDEYEETSDEDEESQEVEITNESENNDRPKFYSDEDSQDEIIIKRKTRSKRVIDDDDEDQENDDDEIPSLVPITQEPPLTHNDVSQSYYEEDLAFTHSRMHPMTKKFLLKAKLLSMRRRSVFLKTPLTSPVPTAAEIVMFKLQSLERSGDKRKLLKTDDERPSKKLKSEESHNDNNSRSSLLPSSKLTELIESHDYMIEVSKEGVTTALNRLQGEDDSDFTTLISKMKDILDKGFGDRVKSVTVIKDSKRIFIAMIPIEPAFFDKIIRGPPVRSPEAVSFRSLWGDYSECRVFADQETCECVYFEAKTVAEKRNIWLTMVKILLNRHLGIHAYDVIAVGVELNQHLIPFDILGVSETAVYGTGEETSLKISLSLEELVKRLRSIKDLPLGISGIQGVSSVFRGCDVHPRPEILEVTVPFGCCVKNGIVMFQEGPASNNNRGNEPLIAIPFATPYEVVVHLEASGKWPDDLTAFRAVKAQFILELATKVKNELQIPTKPSMDYVDVFFEGHVFRLLIAVKKEVVLLRDVQTAIGVSTRKLEDVPEADLLNFQFEILPKLSTAIHCINIKYAAFNPTVRLVKRWLSSQYLHYYIDDLVVDLIVAHLFVEEGVPRSPFSGLLKFLVFVSAFPFHKKAIFLKFPGFDDADQDMERLKLQTSKLLVSKNRPGIVIVTPFDSGRVSLVSRRPDVLKSKHKPGIMKLLIQCSKRAKGIMMTHVQNREAISLGSIFSFSTQYIHVIINLKRSQNKKNRSKEQVIHTMNGSSSQVMPLVGVSPIQDYIDRLRESYGSLAMFLFDPYADEAENILVQWKDPVFRQHSLKELPNQGLEEVDMTAGDSFTYNPEHLIRSFKRLGQGIVKDITAQPQNWPLI